MFKYISCIIIMLPLHIIAASTDEDKRTDQATSEFRIANGIERTNSSDRVIYRKGAEWCALNKNDNSYTHGGPTKVPFPDRRFATLEKQFEGK